nr:DUF3152 domain-containing protein [Dermatophilus congolensis]
MKNLNLTAAAVLLSPRVRRSSSMAALLATVLLASACSSPASQQQQQRPAAPSNTAAAVPPGSTPSSSGTSSSTPTASGTTPGSTPSKPSSSQVTPRPAVPVKKTKRHTYKVITRGKVLTNTKQFAAEAAKIYADPRGWKKASHRFVRVPASAPADFTLVLASPQSVASFSPSCKKQFSCRVGKYVVINDLNWRKKTPAFKGSLDTYHHMVLNHETGHWLGLKHRYCAKNGDKASLMQQQSKSLQGCVANGWPTDAEVASVQ